MQKEKIKKITDKTIALFGFLFFSVLLAGALIFTETGIILLSKTSIIDSGLSAILPLYGTWISIAIVLIYVFPLIFILFIVFEILSNFLGTKFRLILFAVAVIFTIIFLARGDSYLFYYSLSFLFFFALLFLFKELISERKKRIKVSIILVPFFILLSNVLPLMFPRMNYKMVISSHNVYKQQDCDNHKEICLNNMNLNCEPTSSSCYGFTPCEYPMTWSCGKGIVSCNYACPKN